MKTKIICTMVTLLLLSFAAQAQVDEKRFGVELSVGPSFSMGKFLHYRLLPQFGIYGGWGWNHFGTKDSGDGSIDGYEETGYAFGLKYDYPLGHSPVSLYARGGALYKHIEVENRDGDIVGDTGHGWGWQLAGGADISMGRGWHLTPGVKFNSVSRTLPEDNGGTELNLDYIGVRIGVLKTF